MLLKSSLPGTTRHVLLTLSCHVNDAGESCFPSIATLVAETGLSNRAVITHLDNGREAGFITIRKHGFSGQKWARNEYALAWPDEPQGGERRSLPFAEGGERRSQEVVNDVHCLPGSPYIRVFPLVPITPISPVGDGVFFERWWKLYPRVRRFAKAKCKRLWDRKALETQGAAVIKVLEADVASAQWRKEDGQYVPMPATWLGQDRFERESAASAQSGCAVCGVGDAAYKIGGRNLCERHFREADK